MIARWQRVSKGRPSLHMIRPIPCLQFAIALGAAPPRLSSPLLFSYRPGCLSPIARQDLQRALLDPHVLAVLHSAPAATSAISDAIQCPDSGFPLCLHLLQQIGVPQPHHVSRISQELWAGGGRAAILFAALQRQFPRFERTKSRTGGGILLHPHGLHWAPQRYHTLPGLALMAVWNHRRFPEEVLLRIYCPLLTPTLWWVPREAGPQLLVEMLSLYLRSLECPPPVPLTAAIPVGLGLSLPWPKGWTVTDVATICGPAVYILLDYPPPQASYAARVVPHGCSMSLQPARPEVFALKARTGVTLPPHGLTALKVGSLLHTPNSMAVEVERVLHFRHIPGDPRHRTTWPVHSSLPQFSGREPAAWAPPFQT